MNRCYILLLGLLVAGPGPLEAPAARAAVRDVTLTGTVISVETSTGTAQQFRRLAVNTRLGPKTVLIANTTLLLLNNHSTTAASIAVGDRVSVTYDYSTLVASIVEITREEKITGKIVSASATEIDVKTHGAILALKTDPNSVVDLNNILVSNRAVLTGQRGTFIFEPTTNLLLSMNASASLLRSTLTAVDTAKNTVTLAGRSPLTIALDPNATLLRNNAVVPLTSLVIGDRLRVAFTRNTTGTLRLLALSAVPAASAAPAVVR